MFGGIYRMEKEELLFTFHSFAIILFSRPLSSKQAALWIIPYRRIIFRETRLFFLLQLLRLSARAID